MALGTEFRKFIARGNVIDLAVGVVIGAAFSGIVTQLTEAVLMPLIGWIFGDIDFSNWFLMLGDVPEGYEGALDNYEQLKEAGVAMIGYGALITAVINFLIVAMVAFMLVKSVNRAKASFVPEKEKSPDKPAGPTELQVSLEIRDSLQQK